MFLAFLQEQKNRLKRDRAEGERYKERWDEGAMRQRRSKSSSDSITTGRESNWGGLEVRGISVRLWEPSVKKSKPFPISASPLSLSLSLPGLSITTSAFFLPCHNPPSTSSLFPTYVLLTLSYLESYSALKFLKYHYNGNILIIKEQQQCWTCSDLSETSGHMGKLNLLPDVTG